MMKSNLKVLVTGGGGFLGGAIVRQMVEQGAHVRCFSRNRYSELEGLDVEQVPGDIRDPDAVDRACRDVELVFHVAAKPGVWGDYSEFYGINVTGTRNVIRSCRKHSISKLVYTSSPSVVFHGKDMENVDESVPYASHFHAAYPKTKAIAEQEVRNAGKSDGLLTISMRPHLIWGPRDNHLVPRILSRAGQLVQVGDGKNLTDTTYIDNAADAHVLAAESLEKNPALSGNVYFISNGEPVPLWDMVNAILDAGGYPPVSRSIPCQAAWTIGAMLEMIYRTLHIRKEPRLTRFVALELAKAHWFDIRAARRDLGYIPKISIEEGLARLRDWLRDA